MNEQVRRAVVASELKRVCAVFDPEDIWRRALQFLQYLPVRSIAYDKKVKVTGPSLLKKLESPEQTISVLVFGESPDIEKKLFLLRYTERLPRFSTVIGTRLKKIRVHP